MSLLKECFNRAIERHDVAGKWKDSQNERVKRLPSTTAKGDFGQDFIVDFLRGIGIKAEVINGGIGDYDIILHPCGTTFEMKLATEDINNHFQFNAIDKTKKYDYVFCFGVSPNEFYFDIKSKQWCIDNLTTSMTKADGGYKYSAPVKKMILLTEENLRAKIKELTRNVKRMG